MSSAEAFQDPRPGRRPDRSAPLGEVPVARPAFGRSMLFLVLLSVPLWGLIIGGGLLAANLMR